MRESKIKSDWIKYHSFHFQDSAFCTDIIIYIGKQWEQFQPRIIQMLFQMISNTFHEVFAGTGFQSSIFFMNPSFSKFLRIGLKFS